MSVEKKKVSKEFRIRNSLLTDLFENKNIRTIYNIFLAILLGLFVNTVINDYVKNQRMHFGFSLIQKGFTRIHLTLPIWGFFLLHTCAVFYACKLWASYQTFKTLKFVRIWHCGWLLLAGTYYIGSFVTTVVVVTRLQLPIGCAGIVACEQSRFLMKVHAFLRHSVAKVLQMKSDHAFPRFGHFFRFLFCPTLLYRDEYPLRESIDWAFAFYRLVECLGGILFISFVGEKFLIPPLERLCFEPYTKKDIFLIVFENSIAGIFILLAHFFVILHACQNLFGEITRFGDRMFYSDWWTSNFGNFYRKWNIVVQDWLYEYVYKDCYALSGSALLSKFFVLLISAVVHELILSLTLGFFFPLLFFEFLVLGSIVSRLCKNDGILGNVFLWYSLALGTGTLCTLYTVEFYARSNAPIANSSFADAILPRFVTCDCIK